MAVTYSLLTNGANNDGGTTQVTASISPSANKLILVCHRNNVGATPNTPTISGCGITWVQIANSLYQSGNNMRITMWRGMSASPSSGALTFDYSGQDQDQINWQVIQFDGVDISGTNGSGAVVQVVTNTQLATTSLTVTLATFSHTNNATFGMVALNDAAAITQGTGFTEIYEDTTWRPFQTQFRNDNDTLVDWTFATAKDAGGVGVEIKAEVITPGVVVARNYAYYM